VLAEVRSYLLLIGEKMAKRNKIITLAKLTSGLLVLVISVSGCSTLKKATSEAYTLGYETGQGFTQLEDLGSLIDSYLPDDDDASLGSITEEGVVGYCDAIWPITGLTAGIMNSTENKEQFVAGCADGYKSKL
jgi:hypothetical protein